VALGEEGFQAISHGPLFAKCHVYGTRRSLVFAKCQTEALGEADGKGWEWKPGFPVVKDMGKLGLLHLGGKTSFFSSLIFLW